MVFLILLLGSALFSLNPIVISIISVLVISY
jgi:hypothetical protein